jgi:WD40 repeat protein
VFQNHALGNQSLVKRLEQQDILGIYSFLSVKKQTISRMNFSQFLFGVVNDDNCEEGHSGPVNCVSFDESGDFLVSGSHDCKIKLWNLNSNKRLVQSYDAGHIGAIYWYILSPHPSLSLSPSDFVALIFLFV